MNSPATMSQMIALRDALLMMHDKDAAAAVENVIDILSHQDGTEASPTISGGEVLYRPSDEDACEGNDPYLKIPF